jgi:hypothetical protein
VAATLQQVPQAVLAVVDITILMGVLVPQIKAMLAQEVKTLALRTVQAAVAVQPKHLLNQPALVVELVVTEFQVV